MGRRDFTLANTGSMQWELIQAIDGPSIHDEFPDAHGEDLYHLRVSCGDGVFKEAVRTFTDRGMPPLREGNLPGSRYAPPGLARPEPGYWCPEKPAA